MQSSQRIFSLPLMTVQYFSITKKQNFNQYQMSPYCIPISILLASLPTRCIKKGVDFAACWRSATHHNTTPIRDYETQAVHAVIIVNVASPSASLVSIFSDPVKDVAQRAEKLTTICFKRQRTAWWNWQLCVTAQRLAALSPADQALRHH